MTFEKGMLFMSTINNNNFEVLNVSDALVEYKSLTYPSEFTIERETFEQMFELGSLKRL